MADGTTTGDGDDLTLEPTAPGRRRRGPRRALWAALAVVALAAGTVVVSTGGDERPPVLPVSLSGAARELAADSAAGISLAWIHYVAGEDLPALGGEGTAHRLRAAVTGESVRQLAAALGLDGELERDGPTWRVTDGVSTLEVDDLTGSWWYAGVGPDTAVSSDGSAGSVGAVEPCEPGTECVVAEPAPTTTYAPQCTPNGCPEPDLSTEPVPPPDCSADRCLEPGSSEQGSSGCEGDDCVTVLPAEPCPPEADCLPEDQPIVPEPAGDLPSEDEARRVALEVASAAGVDVEAARVTVEGPADAWYVTVEAVLDGLPASGWSTYVAVGPGGAILHAGGLLASSEALGDYPLIDTRAAVDRLNALVGLGAPGDAMGSGASAGSAGAAVASAPPATTPCDPDASVDDPTSCGGGAGDHTVECADAVTAEGQEWCTAATLVLDCPDVPEEMEPYVGPCPEPGTDPTPTTFVEPLPEPMPMPEPEPLEVVLTGAERVLVLHPADDGSSDAYLLPGYRLTSDDGHTVDVAAVTDELLSPTTVPETTVPETTHPDPDEPVVTGPTGPIDCEVLVEDDGSGTTHTIQPCPPTTTTAPVAEPQQLSPGKAPEVGVPYYVDVDLSCAGGSFVLGQRDGIQLIWVLEKGDTSTWGTGHEGGTFTLDTEDHGTFVGDYEGTKQATFGTLGPAEDIFCTPQPRP